MKVLTLPAKQGIQWFFEGYRLLGKNWGKFSGFLVMYWVFIFVINGIPLIGRPIVSLGITPLFVGLMKACQEMAQGQLLTPQVLVSAFKDKSLKTLIALGASYSVLTVVVIVLTIPLDGGFLFDTLVLGQEHVPADPNQALLSFGIAFSLFIPIILMYFFAPMLVAWNATPLFKSLFFSFFACVRNWRAFLVYGISVFIAMVVFWKVALILQGSGIIFLVFLCGLLFIVLPVLYTSFYIAYREIFSVIDEHA